MHDRAYRRTTGASRRARCRRRLTTPAPDRLPPLAASRIAPRTRFLVRSVDAHARAQLASPPIAPATTALRRHDAAVLLRVQDRVHRAARAYRPARATFSWSQRIDDLVAAAVASERAGAVPSTPARPRRGSRPPPDSLVRVAQPLGAGAPRARPSAARCRCASIHERVAPDGERLSGLESCNRDGAPHVGRELRELSERVRPARAPPA